MSSDRTHRVILIHPDAPPKPAVGQPCNGCGVCCASEPCPVGMLVTRRRSGRCAALRWDDTASRHRCGLLVQPAWAHRGVRHLAWRALRRLAARSIAAGAGCDASTEVVGGAG